MIPTDKLIINAVLTGAVLTRKDTPHLPVTVGQIVACVCKVRDAGASIVHLHARRLDGQPSYDAAHYIDLVNRVRKACSDLIVCISLSGRWESDIDKRAAALEAKPDMASLTLGSTNFPKQANKNSPETICELARRIYAVGAIPELEVLETGFINYATYLIRKGMLHPPFYFNIILGSLGSAPLDMIGLGHMVSLLPQGSVWAVGGIGKYQLDANVLSIASGGHVRVGLEDNIYYDRNRAIPADNVRLIERIVRIGRELGREPATPDEAREIIGLRPRLKDASYAPQTEGCN